LSPVGCGGTNPPSSGSDPKSLRTFWRRGIVDLEVLRCEFDAHGYDLVLSRGPTVRHIQFRTKLQRSNVPPVTPQRVAISKQLADKPSSCVIWIVVTPELELGPYYWFGGAPGEPLPDIASYRQPKRIGRRAQGDRPLRANHRTTPTGMFERVDDLDGILLKLFG
jgi:hypothetical protein